MEKIEINSNIDLRNIVNEGDRVRIFFAEGRGHLDDIIEDVLHGYICLRAMELTLIRSDISHIEIMERAGKTMQIGDVKFAFVDGGIRVNGEHVAPALISAIANMLCWEYPNESIDPSDVRCELMTLTRPLTFDCDGIRVGCVRLDHDQLETALDWCAEQLGWW
jgi:hypothetical protein